MPVIAWAAAAALLAGAATLLFAVGMIDDLWGVGPAAKLMAQVGAAGLLMAAGHEDVGPDEPIHGSPA